MTRFICGTWYIIISDAFHMWDVICTYNGRGSMYICHIYLCVQHLYVGHDSIHMWDMVYLSIYMTHFICGAWYTHIMDVARFICATSMYMCNIYLYVQRLFICGTSIYMWNIYLYVEHLFICALSSLTESLAPTSVCGTWLDSYVRHGISINIHDAFHMWSVIWTYNGRGSMFMCTIY